MMSKLRRRAPADNPNVLARFSRPGKQDDEKESRTLSGADRVKADNEVGCWDRYWRRDFAFPSRCMHITYGRETGRGCTQPFFV